MKTMTWAEIQIDWSKLQKRHRLEIGQAVARYCVGHSIHEVASHLDYSEKWVRDQLDYAGIAEAVGDGSALLPITGGPENDNVAKEIPKLLRSYGPTSDEESGPEFQSYQSHYEEQGQSPDVAKRLAKAEWAAEAAIEDGVIQETVNKRNEKVNQILFPSDEKDAFEIDLKMHMARVKAAARFLDQEKINHLRRKATCEKVASAHEAWFEQVERVLNLHPTFNQ